MNIQTADAGNYISYIIAFAVIGYIFYTFIKTRKRMNRPASENTIILSDDNFEKTIKSGVSLVDFWAAWCGPCKVQGPIVDEVADEIGDKANICKLDIDHNQKTARMLGIQSIPTTMIFKNGKAVQKFVGVKPRQVLIKALNSHL